MKENQTKGTVRFSGLSAEKVLESRLEHGENLMAPPIRKAWWKQFLAKFDDPMIRILMIAAVIALGTAEWIESCGILVAVFLATVLSFLNEYKAEKEFDILNKVHDDIPVKTIRDSQFQMIPKKDIVVGDIVFLEMGEEVPADGKVLESVNFQVDQSKLTGESVPVTKVSEAEAKLKMNKEETYPAYMLLRGTPVVEGHGYIEITAVGEKTEIGKTAVAASEDTGEATPLNLQLERLGKLIGAIGFTVAGIVFLALVIHGCFISTLVQSVNQWIISGILLIALMTGLVKIWLPIVYGGLALIKDTICVPRWIDGKGIRAWIMVLAAALIFAGAGLGILYGIDMLPLSVKDWIAPEALPKFVSFFMIAVALIVMAVPEGLAMSVTLSLAYSMRKMTASNNLVRKMHACETIGAATVICTDKTGTLTMNQMRVQDAFFPHHDTTFIAMSIAVNSTANLSMLDPANPQPVGNPTEGALLMWLNRDGFDYELIREAFQITTQWTFSTERKFMATKGHPAGSDAEILFVKGAPEIVMNRCAAFETAGGVQPLSSTCKEEIHEALRTCQARGMRTLGFAYLRNPADKSEIMDVANDMVWMGFVAIADPVRQDVPAAVAACYKAGIQVKMVTGDNPETAKEIGRQIQLWDDGESSKYQLMTGVEFAALSDEEVLIAAKSLKIMARARPDDKLRLVRSLKTTGEIVAVTGDGTNDAPALNYSDVGISMGKTGTAIAKEASDIILLDDSFSSIVNAVMWGRSLYRNIQKFILFQLTVNVVALTIAMTGPFVGIELPLTVIQMLWVNLIMDTLAALALATNPPDPAVMDLPPRKNTAFIVTPAMWGGIFGVGFVFIAVLVGLLFHMRFEGLTENPRWLTLFFCVLVLMQFWNMFNAKCWGTTHSVFHHFADNKPFMIIAAAILIAQVLIVQLGGAVFRTIPLSFMDWVAVIGLTSLIFWGGELFRLIARMKK